MTFANSSHRQYKDSGVYDRDREINNNTIHPLRVFGNELMGGKSELAIDKNNNQQNYNYGLTPYLYGRPPKDKQYQWCHGTFADPFDDIMNAYRELGLRLSIREAAEKKRQADAFLAEGKTVEARWLGKNVQEKISYVSTRHRVHYAVDKLGLAIAVVFSVLGPAATLVLLFWQCSQAMGDGLWKLGREVSRNPLELANAFYTAGSGGGGGVPRWMKQQADGLHMGSKGPGSSGCVTPTSPSATSDSSKSSATVTVTEGEVSLHPQRITLSTIFASCSSNANADQIVEHIKERANKLHGNGSVSPNSGEKDDDWIEKVPRVQYGVDEYTGRLMIVVMEPSKGYSAKEALPGLRAPRFGDVF